MAFDGVGSFSIEPGETLPLNGWRFGNGEDHGAQYFSANPTFDTAGFVLVMLDENKTRFSDGTVAYGFSVKNTDSTTIIQVPIFFNVQGGGFIQGFNVGSFTIAAGETLSSDGWRFGNGEDHGAQYFSANPTSTTGSMLVVSNQRKTRSPGGSVTYGFTIHNTDTSNDVAFDAQGGGFIQGFNVGSFTIGPGDTFPLVNGRFGNGEDHGVQYLSANPTSSAGSTLVISDQSKGRDLNGGVFYGSVIRNTDPDFPVFFEVQGGGYI
jgi:hypothetical protein